MSDESPSIDTGQSAQFEGIAPDARKNRSPLARVLGFLIPFALAAALIVSVSRLPAASGAAKVPFTVATNVPWATFKLDNGDQLYPVNGGDALPSTTLMVNPGTHLIAFSADGFLSQAVSTEVTPSELNEVLVELHLASDATPGVLAAVNHYFASRGYDERAALPAADWQLLGLSHAPQSPFLVVSDALVATALDPIVPVYRETSTLRPVPPATSAVGVAVIVVERSAIYDGCASVPLVQHSLPLISPWTASMSFSLHRVSTGRPYEPSGWNADTPYVLNPQRTDYTPPDQAATGGSPLTAYTLAARTALAGALGDSSLLAAAASPLLQAGFDWGTGLVVRITSTSSPADWLFAGGALTALTPDAARLTSHVPQATAALARLIKTHGLATYGQTGCAAP